MNTLPVLSQPASPPDAPAKAPDGNAPTTPFGQVLSNELANRRSARAAREGADAPRSQDAAAPADAAGSPGGSEAGAAGEAATAAPTDTALETVSPDAATLLGLAATQTGMPPIAPATPSMPSAALAPEAADGLETALDPNARSPRPATLRRAQDARAAAAPTASEDAPADRVPFATPGRGAPQVAADAAQASQAPVVAAQEAKVSDARFEPTLAPALRAAAQALETSGGVERERGVAPPRLAPAVGSAAWGQALGDRIVWMAGNAQQTATLTLNPPNLGPLQVVLNVSNDQAVANFFAAQPEVRQAIEAAMPRLKDMMQDAGIQLEQATVSADTSPRQQDQAPNRPGQSPPIRFGATEPAAPPAATVSAPPRAGRGLVDTFA